MNIIRTALIASCLFLVNLPIVSAQKENDLDALLADPEAEQSKEFVSYTFKSTRIINAHSVEHTPAGVMDSFDFGLLHNLMVGVGRSTFKKEVDAFIKYAPIRQSKGPWSSPVTLAFVSGITVDGLPWSDPTRENYFSSRLAFYHQAILGRKFSEGFTLQFMPTVVHKNLVQAASDPNDIIALGVGGRLKLSKRMALTWDYTHVLVGMPETGFYNPLSIGLDIETGGHVFQLHVTNATGMNERAFITETTGQWGKGQVRFGFNLSRTFQLKKPKLD